MKTSLAAGTGALAGLKVSIPGSPAKIALRTGQADTPNRRFTSAINMSRILLGTPVHVDLTEELPRTGAVISRTYPEAIPPNGIATFVYFDTDLNDWRVIPSVLSSDRRTLSATVHHFSWITDITGELTFQIGRFFDTRVPAPECLGPEPAWVDGEAVYLDDQNAPLRWCAGHDPKDSRLLVVKVAINRGYGYEVTPAGVPTWSWNSYIDRDARELLVDLATDTSSEVSKALSNLASSGPFVPGGESVHYGFSETQVRNSRGRGIDLVAASGPDPSQVVFSLIVDQLADAANDRAIVYSLAALSYAHCARELEEARDWVKRASAVTACLSAADEDIIRELAGRIRTAAGKQLSPKESAAKATKLLDAVIVLMAAQISFQLFNVIGDMGLPKSGRSLSVTLKPEGAPCPNRAQIMRIATGATGKNADSVPSIKCSGNWTGAAVSFIVGKMPDGQDLTESNALIFKYENRRWVLIPRDQACRDPELPVKISGFYCKAG